MNKEMICKNCKYHYIEEISFDYPQSCCSKRNATTEGWCKCNAFEYSDRYIEQLQQENKQLKERVNYLERSNNRREDTMIEQRQEISNLEDNWNKLKQYCEEATFYYTTGNDEYKTKTWGNARNGIDILNKMKELEGSNDNE